MTRHIGTTRTAAALAGSLVLAGALAACGGDDAEGGGGAATTLTIGVTSDAVSLNPLTTRCGPTIYCDANYDSLVHRTADGQFEPDLATSWTFSDAGTTLRLELRDDAVFVDGSKLTGEAVVNSMNALIAGQNGLSSKYFPISSVAADGEHAVVISYSVAATENYALKQIAQDEAIGKIVGPAGLADPNSLETESDGIGPYTLTADGSTKGSVYTYKANPDYFNQDAIKYDTIVMKPMLDGNARYNALKTGQIDIAQSLTSDQASDAEDAGFQVSTGTNGRPPQGVSVFVLANRVDGPLADPKVREAIQYAIPREDITTAVFGSAATPTASLVPEGDEGFNQDDVDKYPYDVAKAQQLLSEAGYADGFTLEVLDGALWDPGQALGQALASSLKEVGITLKLTPNTDPGAALKDLAAKKYDAFMWNLTGSAYTLTYGEFSDTGGFLNPFGLSKDEELSGLIDAAATAPSDQQSDLMEQATARLDSLSWAVAIASVPTLQVVSGDVANVPASFDTTELDPFSPVTELNFAGSAK